MRGARWGKGLAKPLSMGGGCCGGVEEDATAMTAAGGTSAGYFLTGVGTGDGATSTLDNL